MDSLREPLLVTDSFEQRLDRLEREAARLKDNMDRYALDMPTVQETIQKIQQGLFRADQSLTSAACTVKKISDDSNEKLIKWIAIVTTIALAVFGVLALSGVSLGISALVGGVISIIVFSIPFCLNIDGLDPGVE